jgi:hypothetical protein
MGNKSNKKDPNLDILIHLDRNFFYTGELVTGNVTIQARAPLTYDELYICLECKEYCTWTETYGKTVISYKGKR